MTGPRITIRHEVRPTELRAPVVPADAARLVQHGVAVTVEESPQRAFPIADYVAAGCATSPAGSWVDASAGDYIVGLKELPEAPRSLRHRHIFFGHAYKAQPDAAGLLRRFAAGGGVLLDLEYLVGDDQRRLAAFGYWAGYAGAALAVLHHGGWLPTPLRPTSKPALDLLLSFGTAGAPRVLVIGALGRCGRGAVDALRTAGIQPTCWDVEETRELDTDALLDHDIVVNAVLVTAPTAPFITKDLLRTRRRRLTLVADVTCDAGSAHNVVPVYDRPTDWATPARRLTGVGAPLDLIAIDNLPSLLPVEASTSFSAELTPQLMKLPAGDEPIASGAAPWRCCLAAFCQACAVHDLTRTARDLTKGPSSV